MLPATTAVILAGGKSRRMGTDKSLLMVEGQPLVSRVIDAIRPLELPMLLVTNTTDAHAQFHLPMISDVQPECGPLGGLYSALSHITTDCALVVACDMPRLQTGLLRYLVGLSGLRPSVDAVVPRIDGRPQPLHAIYHRRCTPVLLSQLESGRLAMGACLDQLSVQWVEEDALRVHDPHLESFMNLNTPQDVESMSDPRI